MIRLEYPMPIRHQIVPEAENSNALRVKQWLVALRSAVNLCNGSLP